MNPPPTLSPNPYDFSRLGGSDAQEAILAFQRKGVERWTYADMDKAVGRLAAGLRTEAGVKPGDTVMMWAMPTPALMIAILAVLRAQAVVVPIDAQFDDESLKHVLNDAKPKWLFTDARGAGRLKKLSVESHPQIFRVDTNEGETSWCHLLADDAAEPETGDADQRAVIFYTSGTTGAPKGVPLTRANIAYQMAVAQDSGLIRPDDRVLLPLPLHHVYPFVVGFLAPLKLGMAIILPAALAGPQLAQAIAEGEVSMVMGVPRLHRALVDGIKAKAARGPAPVRAFFKGALALSVFCVQRFKWSPGRLLFGSLHRKMGGKLRLMASGGSPLPPEIATQIQAFGWDLAVGYGLTETSPLLTILKPGEGHLDTVGRTVPGTELRIDPSALQGANDEGDDEDADHTPRHAQAGEVQAKGPGVFGGYLNLETASEKAFKEDWYRTGDVGWFDDDGFLHLEGRVSTMLVLEGGENVSPDKLEARYESLIEEIEEIGILQKEGKLVAVIVTRDGATDETAEERIKEALRQRREDIPSYQRLAHFKLVRDELPRTRLGKIRRHKLEAVYDDTSSDDNGPQGGPIAIDEMSSSDQSLLDHPPARAVWDLLAERFADQRLTPASRLEGDLGIDSLGWVELSTVLEAATGLPFGDDVLEKVETVRDLFEAVWSASDQDHERADDPIAEPEKVLQPHDRRWIRPRPLFHTVVGLLLYGVHTLLMRLLYRVQMEGQENLPQSGPYVLTPNHTSFLDAPVIVHSLPFNTIRRFYWAATTNILDRSALVRTLSRLGQVIPIDARRGPMTSLALAAATLKRGDPMVWFPEGHIAKDGKLAPFRPGIGLLLNVYKDVPVVPVHIAGTFAAWPAGQKWPRPGRITINIGKPLKSAALSERGEGEQPHDRIISGLRAAVAELGGEAAGKE